MKNLHPVSLEFGEKCSSYIKRFVTSIPNSLEHSIKRYIYISRISFVPLA